MLHSLGFLKLEKTFSTFLPEILIAEIKYEVLMIHNQSRI